MRRLGSVTPAASSSFVSALESFIRVPPGRQKTKSDSLRESDRLIDEYLRAASPPLSPEVKTVIRKSASIGWSALKDSYHLQQARQNFPEPDYLNALAHAIQNVKPGICFRDAMRQAITIDEYSVGVLGGQELGKHTRAILEAQPALIPAY